MDYQFPSQLFPGFYNRGPPDSVLQHCAGSWGSYGRVLPVGGSGDLSSWTFTSRHRVKGEAWSPTEPAPVPLLSPKPAVSWPSASPDPMEFVEHMQNFYVDHPWEAFGCMADLLGHNFSFQKEKYQLHSFNMRKMRSFLDTMRYRKCQRAYSSTLRDAYSRALADVAHTVPPDLLGSLLHEELTAQRERALAFDGAGAGGALAFVPFAQRGGSSQRGCLLYPGKQGLDSLNFHPVALRHRRGGPSGVAAEPSDRFSFRLKGPVRQISTASVSDHCCAAVRSDHLCGAWSFSQEDGPRLLQVIEAAEAATCVSASPHVLGEVLVASQGGAAALWTVGRGIQKIRRDDDNLYFDAQSRWRWCEFTAHPRVMVYADRTGAELTDIREGPASTHTLFQISSSSECRSGERLSLSRYLGLVHPFHHLITTQHSAYVVDERFAAVPMIKLDHLLREAPRFSHVVPASGSWGGGSETTKLLLGSSRPQEIVMLQYSGGRAEASFSAGPPRCLHRPGDSLKQLPVQLPHRLAAAQSRLSSPASGLTALHQTGRPEEECVCVLQLTEAGDIFYQILQPEVGPACGPDPDQEGGVGGQAEAALSSSSLSAWKRWLAKLMRRRRTTGSGRRWGAQHVLVNAAGLLRRCLAAEPPDPSERERAESLRRELSRCMSQRSLLLRSSVSGAAEPAAPLPERVDADAWTDGLSRRLTASWRGEEAWRSWWSEEQGLDRQRRVEDLKRRRRREKESRRAWSRRLQLSDSFSSSASFLSQWDDLSDSAGGRSAACSGTESAGSQRRRPGPGSPGPGSPAPTPAPRAERSGQEDPPGPGPAPSRSRHALDSCLSSLRTPTAGFTLQGGDDLAAPPPQTPPRADLTQPAGPSSQSSQSRRGRPQPQRRSRMGF